MQAVRKYYEALHQIPECSGAERETAAYVSDVLVSLGYALQQYPCGGVSADLVRAPEAPWIVFRADMDALPVTEEAPVAFASRYPGVMHACGHDAHMAMLLAAAGALAGKTLPQNVRFLFQPAEETTQGAARMLQEGALPKAEAIFGMHVWPGVPLGTLAARPGAQMASSDVFRVQLSGRSVHCARRSLGCDALQAAVAMAAGLPELEKLAENDGSILFLGSLHGGQSHNIVPDRASLYGTLRTYSEQHRRTICGALDALAQQCAAAQGAQASVCWEGGCPPVVNDAGLVRALGSLLPDLTQNAEPSLAAEDFACYQQHIPGVLLWLGIGDTAPLHSPQFCLPEQILQDGVDAWLTIAAHPWRMTNR